MEYTYNAAVIFANRWFSVVVGAAVLFLLYYWGTNKRRRLDAQFPGLPGPKPLPFLGNLLDLIRHKGQLHLQLDDYCKRYGKLFKMFSLGFTEKPSLVVSDPEMIKEIMVKDFSSFHDRPKFANFPRPTDKMLTVLQGDHWRKVRNTLTPTFSAHKMKMMVPLMNECVDVMLKRLAKIAESGESFNIYRHQQRLTLDVIMSSAFGIKTDCQTNSDDPVIAKARAAFSQSVIQKLLIPLLAVLPFGRLLMNTEYVSKFLFGNLIPVTRIAQDMIDTRRGGGDRGRKDLLELMLKAKNPDNGKKHLTDDEIIANSTAFLLAGYETSATTLGLVCYHLATNPDVQDRLQEEIDSVWCDEKNVPTYETVHEMPYLDMVISETLRLCPPGAIISREATDTCIVKGVYVKKGTPILVPVYSIHHDPKIWPEPEKFDPERFTADAKQSRDPYSYMPFGHGPHSCIAMRFAQLEMKLVLTRLLKKFRFKVSAETQIPPKLFQEITLSTPDGIMLKVVQRK